jgi:methionine sulfoxide reductase heme-binding subunit
VLRGKIMGTSSSAAVYLLQNTQEEIVILWFKDNWRWAALNLLALLVIVSLFQVQPKVGDLNSTFVPLVESGKWAIRYLLFSLAMTPLNTVFGWRAAIKLRKPAGLWAFGFGVLHFVFYIADVGADWLQYPIPDIYAALGVLGLAILTPLAATSTRWAMKQLGKRWKRLHRTVYAAGIIALLHGVLEATSSKRVLSVDPQVSYEIVLYLIVLILLLMARIPTIRTSLASLRHRPLATGRR